MLARTLTEYGFSVALLDLHFTLLKAAYEADTESDFKFSFWISKLREEMKLFAPDVIGLSVMFNYGNTNLLEAVDAIKQCDAALPVIAGGVHASLAAEQILKSEPRLSFILLHEAELSLPQFLAAANGDAPLALGQVSLAAVVGGEYYSSSSKSQTLPLTATPFYMDLPLEEYSRVGRIGAYTFLRSTNSVASAVLSRRGCRAKCGFCSVRSFNGPGVSVRDHLDVVDEIAELKKAYGVSHIMWLDDDLFYDNDAAVQMLSTLADRNLDITWDASNGVIAAALNEDLLEACVRSGCVGFNIGIESGNPEILRSMQKPGNVETFLKAARLLDNYPQIFTKGFLIIGYPGETISQLRDTVNLAKAMRLDWYPSQILTPMPGTPVHQELLGQEVSGALATTLNQSTKLGEGRTFSIGVFGDLRRREQAQIVDERPFVNWLEQGGEIVPTREDLQDIYISLDYAINYEPIIDMTDPVRLHKKRLMLEEIATKMTINNPLGTLFYALCCDKLGDPVLAARYLRVASEYLEMSTFWQRIFRDLDIQSAIDAFSTDTRAIAIRLKSR